MASGEHPQDPTEQQLKKMRHAVAWPKCYRNHYSTSTDDADWNALVAMGYARRRTCNFINPEDSVFQVTQAGLDLLLELW